MDSTLCFIGESHYPKPVGNMVPKQPFDVAVIYPLAAENYELVYKRAMMNRDL